METKMLRNSPPPATPEEEEFRWLECVKCGGRWENCLQCPGLQESPFVCESCLGRAGVFKHHPFCATQHANCPVDQTGDKECWWCRVHADSPQK